MEERVVLAGMAVWADGRTELLHDEVAEMESEAAGRDLFAHLVERGFNPNALELVCSDGSLGLPPAIAADFPNAQQQRCITHKVRGMERHLNYEQLPPVDAQQQPLKPTDAKQQRRFEITSDVCEIFQAADVNQAQAQLQSFAQKGQSLQPKAVRTFLNDSELTLTFYQFPPGLHSYIRTTNHLERLFREFRAKSDEIGAFPNEMSCLT